MAVITLGNNTTPVVIGGDVTVNTGNAITTLPVSTPITIQSSGNHSDSLWDLSGDILFPDIIAYKVGLATMVQGSAADYLLTQDTSTKEIKYISGTTYASRTHTHPWSELTTGKPTTLLGYGIADAQPLNTSLTQIAGLSYSSPAFLKRTGINTWVLDTNSYSLSGHTHAYQPTLPICPVDNYVLSSKVDGTLSWVEMITTGSTGDPVPGDIDLSDYITADEPIFTTSFGFSSWRFLPSGSDLLIQYNGVTKATLTQAGSLVITGDVIAFG